MGKGFWLLAWDSWGSGLNMVNPRIITGANGDNFFRYGDVKDKQMQVKILTSNLEHWKVIDQ